MYDAQVISQRDYRQTLYQFSNVKVSVAQHLTTPNQTKADLGYANIYSLIDGIILSKGIEEG